MDGIPVDTTLVHFSAEARENIYCAHEVLRTIERGVIPFQEPPMFVKTEERDLINANHQNKNHRNKNNNHRETAGSI